MFFIFITALLLIVVGAAGLEFFLKMRSLRAPHLDKDVRKASSLTAGRYQPMLRLLAQDDLAFIAPDSKLQKAFRAKRRKLFRGYLRCLTRDYAVLLTGVRTVMVQSGADRPDLARALARNRVLFAVAMCKVEFRLALHTAGIGSVDISGLVDALETLRSQVSVFSAPQTA